MPTRTYMKFVSSTGILKVYVNDTLTLQLEDSGDIIVNKDISATTSTVTGVLYNYSTINSVATVDTTTPACNFATNDYFQLTMPDANKTITFSNPRRANLLLRVQHHANAHTLTFPTAYWVGETGTSAKVYSLGAGNTKYTFFNIMCDGTNYFISDVVFSA